MFPKNNLNEYSVDSNYVNVEAAEIYEVGEEHKSQRSKFLKQLMVNNKLVMFELDN